MFFTFCPAFLRKSMEELMDVWESNDVPQDNRNNFFLTLENLWLCAVQEEINSLCSATALGLDIVTAPSTNSSALVPAASTDAAPPFKNFTLEQIIAIVDVLGNWKAPGKWNWKSLKNKLFPNMEKPTPSQIKDKWRNLVKNAEKGKQQQQGLTLDKDLLRSISSIEKKHNEGIATWRLQSLAAAAAAAEAEEGVAVAEDAEEGAEAEEGVAAEEAAEEEAARAQVSQQSF